VPYFDTAKFFIVSRMSKVDYRNKVVVCTFGF